MTRFWSKAAAEAASHSSHNGLRGEIFPTADPLHCRLAEEIAYARRLLTAVGDELASDRIVVARHAAALQSFDIVGQMLSHLGDVIGSSDPHGTVERIGMAELKARLKRRGLT